MGEKPNLDPTDTFVLDDDELAELDDAGLTGIIEALSDHVDAADEDADS